MTSPGSTMPDDSTAQDDGTATDPHADDKPDTDAPADGLDKADDGKPDDGKGKSDDLEFWKKKAREQESRAKQNKRDADKAAADAKGLLDKIAEAIGVKAKNEDPKAVVETLTTKLSTTEGDLRSARVELAVYRAAGKAGGDADALLDSRGFLKALDALDPADDGFATAVKDAIKDAVKANPKLAAAEAKPKVPRSGGDIPGAPGGGSKKPAGGLAGAIGNHYN
ncbi:hypothetical protein AB0I81_40180 [Nonomuraea sp. NPDC050404]|uniref:hypothetical protein n=1 Tax=Nonomuraea sp. NPDC050404 TaxID=3155783 RepID=UPI0033CFA3AA